MEHAHAHGVHDAVFEDRAFGSASLLQRAATALKRAFQPVSEVQGLETAETVAPRRCPDPYFDVWLEKRLHGTDRMEG